MAARRAAHFGVPAAILVAAAMTAHTRSVGRAEERVFRAINRGPDRFVKPTWVVMQYGSLAAVVAAAAVSRQRGSAAAPRTLAAGLAVWSGVKLVKPLVGRGRPDDHLADVAVRGPAQSGLGFPSGHAAVAVTIALTTTRRGAAARVVSVVVAVATGLARVYVGAHLPLDVVGGAAIGVIAGSAAAMAGTVSSDRGPIRGAVRA